MIRAESRSATVLVPLAGLCLAAVACLSPVHNDTWWHLAYGREMAQIGGFAQFDRFSHTAFGRPFPNHQWLAERIFYGLYSLGGLALLTGFCASLLTCGWVLCWRLSRGALSDRLLIMAGAAAGSTLVWSIRPQVFSLALLPVTATLLVRDRLAWVPLVTLVWANLHGGVLLGLIAIGVWAATELVTGSPRRWRLLGTFALSVMTTFVTPLRTSYWPEIVASLARSQRNRLHEWQAPALPPDNMIFWTAAITLIVLAIRRWSAVDLSARALVATALVFLASATRTLRNIAPFMMMAGPALTALVARPVPSGPPAGASRREPLVLAAAALALSGLIASAWTGPWTRLEWNPVSPGAAGAIRGCPSPIYNTYVGGGPIIWFVPEQRVFVDSRQDSFPDEIVQAATALEGGASPHDAFSRYGVRCAAVPPLSATARALLESGWQVLYQDFEWVVLADRTTE